MNKEKNLNLVSVGNVHIEPLGLYSKQLKGLNLIKPGDFQAKLAILKSQLKKGISISVPNDPTNEARALRLLEKYDIAKFKEGEFITAKDITQNPYEITIVELDAAQLPRALPDVLASVINTNFAAEADLIPSRDAIIMEDKDSPYANVIVVREKDVNNPKIKALIEATQSPAVKEYLEKELAPKGIVPAF
jgi:D-methionine transport system substrate-binding protein